MSRCGSFRWPLAVLGCYCLFLLADRSHHATAAASDAVPAGPASPTDLSPPLSSSTGFHTIRVQFDSEGSLVWNGQRYAHVVAGWELMDTEECPECPECEEQLDAPGTSDFWVDVVVCLFFVAMAGICSGLTIGLFSVDLTKLEILRQDGSPVDKKRADILYPLLKNHHFLLVTLLITNAGAMEALPIFLGYIMPEYMAIVFSVTCVLFFGEIIPQAICTKNPLAIGASLAWLVQLLGFIWWPIAYPIAKLLDRIVGDHGDSLLNRSELQSLISLHGFVPKPTTGKSGSSHGHGSHGGHGSDDKAREDKILSVDEVTIIKGALSIKFKTVEDVYTPLEHVFMLDMEAVLDHPTLASVMAAGHARIPVFSGSRENIKGLLLVNKLILVDPTHRRKVASLLVRRPIVVAPSTGLLDLLNEFQLGRSHMAIVTTHPEIFSRGLLNMSSNPLSGSSCKVLGIITLEDVLEELIQEDIHDENDVSFSRSWTRRNMEFKKRPTELVIDTKSSEGPSPKGPRSAGQSLASGGSYEMTAPKRDRKSEQSPPPLHLTFMVARAVNKFKQYGRQRRRRTAYTHRQSSADQHAGDKPLPPASFARVSYLTSRMGSGPNLNDHERKGPSHGGVPPVGSLRPSASQLSGMGANHAPNANNNPQGRSFNSKGVHHASLADSPPGGSDYLRMDD